MQKIFLILAGFGIFFGLSAAAATARAQDKTAGKKDVKQLEAIYKQFDAATKKRDLKTYEKYLDETFAVEQETLKIPRREILELLKQFFDSAVEITEAVSTIEKIRVTDGNYFLEVSSFVKGKFKMPGAGGRISVLQITSQSTDVWIKTGKGWKQISQIDRGSKILPAGN
ncbi:MAG TPA: nuclear transport factor 2 family protein [Pyrinomonadaceae bacterium]|jgi:ketosteroid isomerase-like protein